MHPMSDGMLGCIISPVIVPYYVSLHSPSDPAVRLSYWEYPIIGAVSHRDPD